MALATGPVEHTWSRQDRWLAPFRSRIQPQPCPRPRIKEHLPTRRPNGSPRRIAARGPEPRAARRRLAVRRATSRLAAPQDSAAISGANRTPSTVRTAPFLSPASGGDSHRDLRPRFLDTWGRDDAGVLRAAEHADIGRRTGAGNRSETKPQASSRNTGERPGQGRVDHLGDRAGVAAIGFRGLAGLPRNRLMGRVLTRSLRPGHTVGCSQNSHPVHGEPVTSSPSSPHSRGDGAAEKTA